MAIKFLNFKDGCEAVRPSCMEKVFENKKHLGKTTIMKNILLSLFLILAGTTMQAQPNIQHSIYFKEKFCQDSLFGFHYTLAHSKGGRYMTYSLDVLDNTWSVGTYFAKLDNNWDTLWTKLYNGPGDEVVDHILELPNGNILLAGRSESNDGGIIYNDKNGRWIWMMEVDTNGNFIKSHSFGSGACELTDASISTDGFILLAGNTNANQYDFTHVVLGSAQAAWIAKYDTAFNKIWIKVIDGSGEDGNPTIKEITPNRFMVGFQSDGTDTASVPLEAKGKLDLIVHYIDSGANVIWKHRYGSVEHDASKLSVVDPLTSNIYFVGYNEWSATGNVTYAGGSFWIHSIDTFGNIKGSKSYGAAINVTYTTDAIWYNEKLWVFGDSQGGAGDMDTNAGAWNTRNAWIGIIDTNVNLVAKYTLASDYNDQFADAFINKGDLMVNGVVIVPFCPYKCGTVDAFGYTFNIGQAPLGIYETTQTTEKLFTIYPNPSASTLYLKMAEKYIGKDAEIKVMDIDGRTVYRSNTKHLLSQEQIDCASWKAGNYTVQMVIGKTKQWSEKFTKIKE